MRGPPGGLFQPVPVCSSLGAHTTYPLCCRHLSVARHILDLPVFGPVVSIAVSKSAWARMPQEARPFTKQIDLRLIPGCAEIAEIADVFAAQGPILLTLNKRRAAKLIMITVASNPRSNAVTR